ncbi:MAG: TadE/TadG family type IV pilus assembly protein [Alphaproteobacteria bacterium]
MMNRQSLSRGFSFWAFRRDEKGAMAVEGVMFISVLSLILVAVFELGMFMLAHQKIDRAARTVADLVAQGGAVRGDTITASEMQDIFHAVDHQTSPFDLVDNGEVIVSVVSNDVTNGIKILDQRKYGQLTTATSKIGTQGGAATLPTGFSLHSSESVIIAETIMEYTPYFLSNMWVKPQEIRHMVTFKPRRANLVDIQ